MELKTEVGKIINIEVAVATCGGKKNIKIIVGTINEPPPMPKIPDKNPTTNEITTPRTGLNPYSYVWPLLSVNVLTMPFSLRNGSGFNFSLMTMTKETNKINTPK